MEILAEEQVELAYPSQIICIKEIEGEHLEVRNRQKEYN
jgi:hypothetical protein